MKYLIVLVAILYASILGGVSIAYAQEVFRHDDQDRPLDERWDRAVRAADGAGWIGLSIERLAYEGHFYGRWDSHPREPSVGTLIFGDAYDAGSLRDAAEEALAEIRRKRDKRQKVLREQVVFFEIDAQGRVTDGCMLDLSQHFDAEGLPIYWLGRVADADAMPLFKAQYARASTPDAQEIFVTAVGLLDDVLEASTSFLADVLGSRTDDDVREQAAFWIGQQNRPEGMRILLRTIERDRSTDVREHAVFGLSQMTLPEATDELIGVARSADNHEVRKKAIFWLGQQASEKAVEALEEVVDNDPETEIKKQAVFALSQLPDDEATTILLRIAQTNPNPEVRKQAIFWLGQQDDPRALEALVAILKG